MSITVCYAIPKQVTVIRHAERFDSGPFTGQLMPKGFQRVGAFASFFTEVNPGSTNVTILANGIPDVLFASRPVIPGFQNTTTRCIQTLSALATTLRLPIHSGYGFDQEQELANFILTNPDYDGKNILICWHSTKIHKLIEYFGYLFPYLDCPDSYPDSRFDLVWLMPLPAPSPAQVLLPILQELLFDDLTTLPICP